MSEKKYWYESHLGNGYYSSDEYLSYEYLCCEQCGDSDTYIGYMTEEEFAEWKKGENDYE